MMTRSGQDMQLTLFCEIHNTECCDGY